MRRVLHTFFNLALENGYVMRNPVKAAMKIRLKDSQPKNITVREFTRILEGLPSDEYRSGLTGI
jgi:site-specific recombinase XerD